MPAENLPVVDLESIDFSNPIANREQIEAVIPHRHEMSLLTGVLSIDPERKIIVGYKDVGHNEFWSRGHFPEFQVMPGVLMCESAAQLTSYYMHLHGGVSTDRLIGLGGIESARFREPVRPGERLVLVGVGRRIGQRLSKFDVSGHIRKHGKYEFAFEVTILGVILGSWEDLARA